MSAHLRAKFKKTKTLSTTVSRIAGPPEIHTLLYSCEAQMLHKQGSSANFGENLSILNSPSRKFHGAVRGFGQENALSTLHIFQASVRGLAAIYLLMAKNN